MGVSRAAEVLSQIDEYYADQNESDDGVASQIARQLADPKPADPRVIDQLFSYRRLSKRWSEWSAIEDTLGQVASRMAER